MGAFNLFSKALKKDSQEENYLALTINPNKVSACVWRLNGDNIEIIGIATKEFDDIDNLTHQAAAAIDSAAHSADLDEVTKTVFGLSHYFLKDQEPTEDIAKMLSVMAKDLELDPQAFVPVSIAINHLLKIDGDTPKNAILVGVSPNCTEVHLIEDNKVVDSKVDKSQTTFEKVLELIQGLKKEDSPLPRKIFVYPHDHSSIVKKLKEHDFKELISASADVEELGEDETASAVAYAQALDILGHEPTALTHAKGTPEHTAPSEERGIAAPPITKTEASGFFEDADVLEAKNKIDTPDTQEEALKKEDYAVEVPRQHIDANHEQIHSPKSQRSSIFAKIPLLLKPFSRLTKVPMRFFDSQGLAKLVLIIVAILAIVLIGGYVAAQNLTAAEVVIKVNAQSTEKDFSAKSQVGASFDPSNFQIPGQEIIGNADGSQKAVATGAKTIGDKAKGSVKILNWDKQAKSFGQGTEVITKDGLKFTLDSEVTIASRSATTPGENKTAASSSDVGSKFNVIQGTELVIVGYDEILYTAIADTAFAGGSERKVTVVSKEDLDRLDKSLTESTIVKAKADLAGKTGGLKLNDAIVQVKVVKKDFDKKLDEEASLVNLNVKAEASAIVYDENELKKLFAQIVNKEAENSNLQARAEDTEILAQDIKRPSSNQSNVLNITGKFRAKLIPKLSEEELKNKIAGKSTKDARALLRTMADVTSIEVKHSPNLPLIDAIPGNKSKIKVIIEAN